MREAIKSFDRNLPLVRMQPLQTYADLGMLPQRMAASVAGSLGLVALLLAGIGIYGVTAFAVASRTREIGVRMALGADRSRVVRMVLWQGVRLTATGAAIGLALSLGVTQLLGSLLFGVSPLDPVTYGTTLVNAGRRHTRRHARPRATGGEGRSDHDVKSGLRPGASGSSGTSGASGPRNELTLAIFVNPSSSQ